MDKNLPIAPEAIGNYVTYKKIGNYVYTSGHVPITEQKKYIGKVPTEISIDEAYKAAELCAELTIATIKKHGSIDNLQPVNVIGFVNAHNPIPHFLSRDTIIKTTISVPKIAKSVARIIIT